MANKASCTSIFAALVLIVVNILVVLASLAFLTFGIWAMASPSTLSGVIQTIPYTVVKALLPPQVVTARLGAGVAAVSSVIGCIAIMGLRGAVSRSPFLLFMYASLIFLLLLLECALFYYFASSFIEKGLQDQDGQWTHAIRLILLCCEYNSSSSAEVSRPWSCCGVDAYPDNCTLQLAYDKDCRQTISSWVSSYQTTLYASLAGLHILLFSCALLRRQSASHSYS
ncbi:CD151 antigen-like [Plodia interpunctella]|uniref:CD151 antigen-like n=1 Tax=Plodia interpunctella TaxID=58824 RepID=UPI002368B00A|nr:CD151 antigen-like [Plodia interpunctella]XP_053603052.1 CD151 antigen-like [Plodia interpunctella]XP_053603053.1 CD151 antigen-like [Plodia interpunctella]